MYPKSKIRQIAASLIGDLLYISAGCVMAWTSPVFPKLGNSLSEDEQAFISSLSPLGSVLGVILAGLACDRIGRKGALYSLATCYLSSWIILFFSTNVYVICVGRTFGGMGVGGTFTTVSILTAETAEVDLRETLGSYSQFFVAIGYIIEYCIGPYVSYKMLSAISATTAIAFVICFYFVPETPYYLLSRGKRTEATESLRWYRADPPIHSLETELAEMEKITYNMQSPFKSVVALLRDEGPRTGFLISLYLLFILQASAPDAMTAFTQQIFEKTNMQLPGEISPMIMGVANALASLPAPFLVNRFSFKPILIFSGIGVGLSQGLLGLYFYFQDFKYDMSHFDALPIISIILYNIFYCTGWGPLPWAFVAQTFSVKLVGFATLICGVYASSLGFGCMNLFAVGLDKLGAMTVFFSFSAFMTLGSIGAIFIVPNTKGMSLGDIQDYLDSGKKHESTLNQDS